LDNWITDALPLAAAAGSRVEPPLSLPDGAYPNSNGSFRPRISTESTSGLGPHAAWSKRWLFTLKLPLTT
jgi:hypothetical protein